jgi:hypothetical protein
LGLAATAESLGDSAVHLLEVGASAGLVLRHDAYGYRLGDRHFGDPASPVQLGCEWRSGAPVPDLDAIPRVASTTGIDLNPLDPANEADRLWLAALVWPEDRHKAQLLRAALTLAARRPVVIRRGDAVDLCPRWADALPAGTARVVFHCATRMHVPADRRAAFDAAIEGAGADGPLHRIALERDLPLVVTGPDGGTIQRYEVDGHLAWAKPAAAASG